MGSLMDSFSTVKAIIQHIYIAPKKVVKKMQYYVKMKNASAKLIISTVSF
jgi:hypothetical protein